MIHENAINQAAAWIANQQRDPFEDKIKDTIAWAARHPYYLEQARTKLAQLAASGHNMIGMSVPCEPRANGDRTPVATVHVEPDRIFGYLPGEVRPSFIWPPDLAVKLRAKWENKRV